MADNLISRTFPEEIYVLEESNSSVGAPCLYKVYHNLYAARSMKTRKINAFSHWKETKPEKYAEHVASIKIYKVSLGQREEI